MQRLTYEKRLAGVELNKTPVPKGAAVPKRLALEDSPMRSKLNTLETQLITRDKSITSKRATYHPIVLKQDGKIISPTLLASAKEGLFRQVRVQLRGMKFLDKKTGKYGEMKSRHGNQFTNVLTEWATANQQGILLKMLGSASGPEVLWLADRAMNDDV